MGRLIGRDPIESDPNLYRYCGDNPVIHVDPSGLKWHVDREGQPRATAWNDDSTDTIKELADQIHLTANEYKKWLKAEGKSAHPAVLPNELPCDENTAIGRCRVFSVPNTAYIDVSTYTWGFYQYALMGYESGMEAFFESHGLKVMYTGKRKIEIPFFSGNHWATKSNILTHLGSDDIYVYMYIGHCDELDGAMEYLTAVENDSGRIKPGTYTQYGIYYMDIIGCYSDLGRAQWATNVSSNGGTLVTVKGEGWIFSTEFVTSPGTR
jgi:hypothetical protein